MRPLHRVAKITIIVTTGSQAYRDNAGFHKARWAVLEIQESDKDTLAEDRTRAATPQTKSQENQIQNSSGDTTPQTKNQESQIQDPRTASGDTTPQTKSQESQSQRIPDQNIKNDSSSSATPWVLAPTRAAAFRRESKSSEFRRRSGRLD